MSPRAAARRPRSFHTFVQDGSSKCIHFGRRHVLDMQIGFSGGKFRVQTSPPSAVIGWRIPQPSDEKDQFSPLRTTGDSSSILLLLFHTIDFRQQFQFFSEGAYAALICRQQPCCKPMRPRGPSNVCHALAHFRPHPRKRRYHPTDTLPRPRRRHLQSEMYPILRHDQPRQRRHRDHNDQCRARLSIAKISSKTCSRCNHSASRRWTTASLA